MKHSDITRRGKYFYLQTYYPKPKEKCLGCLITINGHPLFMTTIKDPAKHFMIKIRGYAINTELLRMLRMARIKYLLIPEDGKTGFRVYHVTLDTYLYHGETIKEPHTEEQTGVPLYLLDQVTGILENTIKNLFKIEHNH